jgi:histidinol-phosphatase (PHP family)
VVCHLDAVMRHCSSFTLAEEHFARMGEMMALMREKDIALEVNTSGFVLRGEPFPSSRVVKEAQQLGIRLVAGSDAHRPQDVGRYFDWLPGLVG